jgi:hypothetical protein
MSRVVTTDGLWIGELDLLTTYTHNSELQVFTALWLSPPFTNHYTLSLSSCLSNSRSLATASNMEIFQLSALTPLLSGKYTATELTWGPHYMVSGRTQQKTPPPIDFLLLLWAVA